MRTELHADYHSVVGRCVIYCPRCLTPYRDGFFECADCRVPLVVELPPRLAEAGEVELVNVLEIRDSFALSLAKAALEDAGIDYLVTGEEPRFISAGQGAFGLGAVPSCACSCRIQVAPECVSEARALLEPLEHPEPDNQQPSP